MKYYELIEVLGGRFRVVPKDDFLGTTENHYFFFQPYGQIALNGKKSLKTFSPSNKSGLIELSFPGFNKAKIADFLNATSQELRNYELEEKNIIAVNTIRFIDSQLDEINGELAQRRIT